MIKQISHIILVFLLLIATTGLAISKHYCGENLVSVAIAKEAESCCDNKTGDCCHNETERYQVKENFIQSSIQHNLLVLYPTELIINYSDVLQVELPVIHKKVHFFSDSPPPPKIQKVLSSLQTYLL